MAEGNANPFTNTRLMIAGVLLGVVGAGLGWYYVNQRVRLGIGDTVAVYYMKEPLTIDKPIEERHVTIMEIPAKAATKVLRAGEFPSVKGRMPTHNMEAGEPVVTTAFPYGEGGKSKIPVDPGKVRIPVRVDPRVGPGEQVRVGSVVNLLGNVNVGEGRTEDKQELYTIRVGAVVVKAINGKSQPTANDLKTITSLNVDVGKETSERLKKVEQRKVGDWTIEILTDGTSESRANEEISPTDKAIIDKLDARSAGRG